mmetsp:Transcript_13798/g.36534  ORF Transcript_13798/g.36534 Transcript_13798/m.36534 type:complete len:242 (+) Transcript_13798:219-944(+)
MGVVGPGAVDRHYLDLHVVRSRHPHRNPPLPDDDILAARLAHAADRLHLSLDLGLQLRRAGGEARRVLDREDQHVVPLDRAPRPRDVGRRGRRDDHVLLHLRVHEAEPTVRVGLDDDGDLALLLRRAFFPLAHADGDLPAADLEQLVHLAGGLRLFRRREGHPPKTLARLAVGRLVAREVHALDLAYVLECGLDAPVLDVRRQPAKEDLVRNDIVGPLAAAAAAHDDIVLPTDTQRSRSRS